jgi:hypothetical protein
MTSRTRTAAAAGAAAALAASLAFAAPAAQAATPQCGTGCASLYNLIYGTSVVMAVAGAQGTNANTGQPVALLPASGSNQGEDWALFAEGTVSDFYAAGIVSAQLNFHYANDEVYEYDYVPYGVDSGLCLGVAGTAGNGAPVSLQPCGVDAQTLWVADTADQYRRQIPLINGTDNNFSYPYVLTANSTGITMSTHMLTGGNGVIDQGQYWSTIYGVLP